MARSLTRRTVEQWTLKAVEAMLNGAGEDAQVEFKRELSTDFPKLAKRIAGHANAARGEPILWVVGVDAGQKKVTLGTLPEDGANYWPQMWSKFDGPHPELVDLAVDYEGTSLLALGFQCDLVPYVVRTGQDSPRFEVPWREGTRVDSATRSQLIRMMMPVIATPVVEYRHVISDGGGTAVTLFVVPPSSVGVMVPIHRTILEVGTEPGVIATSLTADGTRTFGLHPMVKEAHGEGVYLSGPAHIVAKWNVPAFRRGTLCRVRLQFEPGSIDAVVPFVA